MRTWSYIVASWLAGAVVLGLAIHLLGATTYMAILTGVGFFTVAMLATAIRRRRSAEPRRHGEN
ncbi:hypothetical protein ESZ53_10580 [Salinibacterium sp. UTAS2018]|mgnify:CR=1 FL=1|uniref:hypothetical protein n=1 Tax=Salinibacterium sp. UTAS2018 TaxID=2508880 RepID=UPI0010094DA0|nr:hypothetical protein [Salinibacterium sp. UTAS2018]QAV70847.1 hypothetical protein ESZ53_10580 [Salinibacterium sp. UTAS2018]|tara:strand:- start:353 stop:544 length:192 start_codon:yes stop_codon:yes gene_type:complete